MSGRVTLCHWLTLFSAPVVSFTLTPTDGRVRDAAALRAGVPQGGADDQDRDSADSPTQKDGESDA